VKPSDWECPREERNFALDGRKYLCLKPDGEHKSGMIFNDKNE